MEAICVMRDFESLVNNDSEAAPPQRPCPDNRDPPNTKLGLKDIAYLLMSRSRHALKGCQSDAIAGRPLSLQRLYFL